MLQLVTPQPPTAMQWREAAMALRYKAAELEERAERLEAATLSDITACGPYGRPLQHVEDLRRKVEAQDREKVADELRDLWQRALEREGNLASAVADVVWKATQFGETEDGDTYAYIVPKGAMHRLVGVAQQNGAHVPVAFRAPVADSEAPA